MKAWKYLPLVLLLAACGSKSDQPTARGRSAQLGQQSVTILEGSRLDSSEGAITGTGSVLVDADLVDERSNRSFAIDFRLGDSGSLNLISHSDVALQNGVEMLFERDGDTLNVDITAQGITRTALDSNGQNPFLRVDPRGVMRFQVDVHNNENPARVIAWNRLATGSFTPGTALFDTYDARRSPGIGSSTRWGLILNNASVSMVRGTQAMVRQ